MLFMQIDSLSLQQAIDRAFEHNPQYYESKITLDKSRTLYVQALCNYLPTSSVSGSYTERETDGQGAYPYSASVSLTQPVLDIDLINAITDSRQQSNISQIQYESEIASLILDVTSSYYNLVYARELLASSDLAIERAKENLDLIDMKYSIGAASKLDKLQAEVFYLSTQQDRAKAKTLLTSAQAQLRTLLNSEYEMYPTDSLVEPTAFEFPSLDTLLVVMEKANYTIRTARTQESQARSNLTFTYLAFLPKVSFFYGKSFSSEQLTWDYDVWEENSSYNYGVRVSLPVFELRSRIFDNITARQDLKIKEYAAQRAVLEQRQSLESTYAGLIEVREQLQYAGKSLNAATEAAVIARAQYALGTVSFIELLKAEEDAYTARVSYISALAEFYDRRLELSYLLGSVAGEETQ